MRLQRTKPLFTIIGLKLKKSDSFPENIYIILQVNRTSKMAIFTHWIIFVRLCTFSDLGDLSNPIGSLSRGMPFYSPQWAVNLKQNKIAVVNWVFCQSSK